MITTSTNLLVNVLLLMIMMEVTISNCSKFNNNNNMLPIIVPTNGQQVNRVIIPGIDLSDTSSISIKKVCRVCKNNYNPFHNTLMSCRFHKGKRRCKLP